MRTRSTLRGEGDIPEHIPVCRALLETTDPHQKTDLIHVKMLTRFTLEHIPVSRALLEIEIEINFGTHPRFRALLEIEIEIEIEIDID